VSAPGGSFPEVQRLGAAAGTPLSPGVRVTGQMRYVAYGAGGAFQNIVRQGLLPFECAYAVDNNFGESAFLGIPVFKPERLRVESKNDLRVVLFTMSSTAYREIRRGLIADGFRSEDVIYYGDLFIDGLRERLSQTGIGVNPRHYAFARTVSEIFDVEDQSSALGTAVFLALTHAAPSGAIVELGVYRGGNVLLTSLVGLIEGRRRPFYAIDSFEGFPELSRHDPTAARGMFRDVTYEEVTGMLASFPDVVVCRGFIPDVFRGLPDHAYSVVYYDCDLYQPALDTLAYFFPRVSPGGFMMFHDYLPKVDGFGGVRLAVEEFFGTETSIDRIEIPETTHLIVRKK
jgi:hypothetical protein